MNYKHLIESIEQSQWKNINQFSKALGKRQDYIYKLLVSKKIRLKVEQLEEICNLLEIHPHHFLDFNPDHNKPQRKSSIKKSNK